MKALINVRIYDYQNYIENGYIIFDQDIKEVGHMDDFKGAQVIVNGKGKLVLPGLVNGHTHVYSTLFRGSPLRADPKNFGEVLEQIWWRFDKALTKESIIESGKAYAELSYLHGVTVIIDHHASGEVEDSLYYLERVFHRLGMKNLLCFETSDRFNIDECIRENLRVSEHINHFGLHASLSLCHETLSKVASMNDLPIHVHVAESILDENDAMEKYGKRVLDRLQGYNLLKKDSILAHCTHIDEKEAKVIVENECVVAINPTSNMNNGVGVYPYALLYQYKIPVLVGTDGLGANIAKEYQQLYFAGNLSLEKSGGVSLDWVRDQLVFSYDYFNRMAKTKIGQIKKGYDADFMLLDYYQVTPITRDNIFAHILFGVFEGLRPYAVYCKGVKMVDQCRLVNQHDVDVGAINELWGKICD